MQSPSCILINSQPAVMQMKAADKHDFPETTSDEQKASHLTSDMLVQRHDTFPEINNYVMHNVQELATVFEWYRSEILGPSDWNLYLEAMTRVFDACYAAINKTNTFSRPSDERMLQYQRVILKADALCMVVNAASNEVWATSMSNIKCPSMRHTLETSVRKMECDMNWNTVHKAYSMCVLIVTAQQSHFCVRIPLKFMNFELDTSGNLWSWIEPQFLPPLCVVSVLRSSHPTEIRNATDMQQSRGSQLQKLATDICNMEYYSPYLCWAIIDAMPNFKDAKELKLPGECSSNEGNWLYSHGVDHGNIWDSMEVNDEFRELLKIVHERHHGIKILYMRANPSNMTYVSCALDSLCHISKCLLFMFLSPSDHEQHEHDSQKFLNVVNAARNLTSWKNLEYYRNNDIWTTEPMMATGLVQKESKWEWDPSMTFWTHAFADTSRWDARVKIRNVHGGVVKRQQVTREGAWGLVEPYINPSKDMKAKNEWIDLSALIDHFGRFADTVNEEIVEEIARKRETKDGLMHMNVMPYTVVQNESQIMRDLHANA